MLDVIVPATPAVRRDSWVLAAVFSATLFLSAFLMFLVEPMIARMVLPTLGGAASVWNTCLVFFQAVLLCGYGYAHVATTMLGARRQAMVHAALVAAPLLLLPITLPATGAPPAGNPVWWLLLTLLTSVGLPFFALSTSAGVLQKWYAATDAEGARDPYFLYAASNMGSFAGLLTYPLFVERAFRLQQQTQIWTAGYALLALLTFVCALSVARPKGRAPRVSGASQASEVPVAEAVPWARRARWTLLAFVPSSLLLAVTSHMSTDVAAVPMLWMVPLGIYLTTFVVAFSPSASRARALASRFMPLGVLVLTLVLIAQMNQPVALILPLHLLVFGVVALACHGDLANDRPGPARLTEFYFWVSLGGMLGGLFNALIAPVVFTGIVEYPLVLVLACADPAPGCGGATRRLAAGARVDRRDRGGSGDLGDRQQPLRLLVSLRDPGRGPARPLDAGATEAGDPLRGVRRRADAVGRAGRRARSAAASTQSGRSSASTASGWTTTCTTGSCSMAQRCTACRARCRSGAPSR